MKKFIRRMFFLKLGYNGKWIFGKGSFKRGFGAAITEFIDEPLEIQNINFGFKKKNLPLFFKLIFLKVKTFGITVLF